MLVSIIGPVSIVLAAVPPIAAVTLIGGACFAQRQPSRPTNRRAVIGNATLPQRGAR